jgi:hypothetical protein
MFAVGNHEASILDRHGVDLLQNLANELNTQAKANVSVGGISGYVRFVFHRGGSNGRSQSKTLWYHHGGTPGGPVTRGVVQTSRRAVFVSDADIVITGHQHSSYIVPIARIKLSKSNRVEKSEQVHIQVPGYKDEFDDGASGWANLREHPPRSKGSCWVRFVVDNDRISTEFTMTGY